jgi:hypothetical protein
LFYLLNFFGFEEEEGKTNKLKLSGAQISGSLVSKEPLHIFKKHHSAVGFS